VHSRGRSGQPLIDIGDDLATGADDKADSVFGPIVGKSSGQNGFAAHGLTGMCERGHLHFRTIEFALQNFARCRRLAGL